MRTLTNIHGSVSVSGVAHVTGAGAKEALCFIKAQNSVGGSGFLEQGINVLWGVTYPLGHQPSTVHNLRNTKYFSDNPVGSGSGVATTQWLDRTSPNTVWLCGLWIVYDVSLHMLRCEVLHKSSLIWELWSQSATPNSKEACSIYL